MGFNPDFFPIDDYRSKHVETIAKQQAGYKYVTRLLKGALPLAVNVFYYLTVRRP